MKLEKIVISALENVKALDIVSLNVHKLTSITDVMVIATGTSDKHCRALAENVVEEAKKQGHLTIGEDYEGGWMLIDLGEVIVHVMLRQVRDFYNLEKLWTKDSAES